MLYGNFKPQNIARRSRAFEQFLTHVYSVDLLRSSPEFASFFYLTDLREGYTLIQNGKYADALVLLQSSVRLQRKLHGDSDPEVVATLCAMVCCCDQLDQKAQTQSYSELALGCIGLEDSNKFLVPLLQLTTRICWKLGKDKTDLEARLQSLRDKGINVDTCPSLLEMVIVCFPKSWLWHYSILLPCTETEITLCCIFQALKFVMPLSVSMAGIFLKHCHEKALPLRPSHIN